jgi:hypothetical protein
MNKNINNKNKNYTILPLNTPSFSYWLLLILTLFVVYIYLECNSYILLCDGNDNNISEFFIDDITEDRSEAGSCNCSSSCSCSNPSIYSVNNGCFGIYNKYQNVGRRKVY